MVAFDVARPPLEDEVSAALPAIIPWGKFEDVTQAFGSGRGRTRRNHRQHQPQKPARRCAQSVLYRIPVR